MKANHDRLDHEYALKQKNRVSSTRHPSKICRTFDSLIAGDMAPRQGTCQESSSVRPEGQRLYGELHRLS